VGTYDDTAQRALDQVTGGLIGENLLSEFKAAMIEEAVFQRIFGKTGERIYVGRLPNYNDKVVPLIEFWWSEETWNNWDLRQPGTLNGRIVLPTALEGDFNRFRQLAATLFRFIGAGQHRMFERVPGLVKFGKGMSARYDRMIESSGAKYPVILFTLPFQFDGKYFEQLNEGIDLQGRLDAEAFDWLETSEIQITAEKVGGQIEVASVSVGDPPPDGP
jgi:hypothetical protein